MFANLKACLFMATGSILLLTTGRLSKPVPLTSKSTNAISAFPVGIISKRPPVLLLAISTPKILSV